MSVLSMVWGILALIGMVIAFFPCLGSLNWLNIPFSVIGAVISIIALVTSKAEKNSGAVVGLVLCVVAVVVGLGRLVLGGGIL